MKWSQALCALSFKRFWHTVEDYRNTFHRKHFDVVACEDDNGNDIYISLISIYFQ